MLNAGVAPYGAFELKATYRRNMLLGILFSFMFAAFVIGSVWIVYQIIGTEVVTVDPVPIDTDDSGPIPFDDDIIIVRDEEPGPVGPRPEQTFKQGPIVLVDDSLFANEGESETPNLFDRESYPIAGPSFGTGEGEFDGSYAYRGTGIPGDDYPDPDKFIIVEKYPVMIQGAVPEYPRLAKLAGEEGRVCVKVLLDEEGRVIDAMLEKLSGTKVGFEEAALKAAYGCIFSPAIQNGRPVKIWVTFCFEFDLDKNY